MVLSTYSDATAEALQKSLQREFTSKSSYPVYIAFTGYRAFWNRFEGGSPWKRHYKTFLAVSSPSIFVVAWGINSGLASIHNFSVHSEHAHYQCYRLRITFKFGCSFRVTDIFGSSPKALPSATVLKGLSGRWVGRRNLTRSAGTLFTYNDPCCRLDASTTIVAVQASGLHIYLVPQITKMSSA